MQLQAMWRTRVWLVPLRQALVGVVDVAPVAAVRADGRSVAVRATGGASSALLRDGMLREGRARSQVCKTPSPFLKTQRRRGLRQRQLSRHGTPGLGAEAAEPAAPSAALVRAFFSRRFGTVGPEVRRHLASLPLDRQLHLQRAALQFAGRDLIQSFHILLSGHFGVERGHNMRFQASLRLNPGDLPRNLRTWVAVVRGPEATHAHLSPRSVPPFQV